MYRSEIYDRVIAGKRRMGLICLHIDNNPRQSTVVASDVYEVGANALTDKAGSMRHGVVKDQQLH